MATISRISFGLDEDQQLIQEVARKFAREVLRPQQRLFEQQRGIPAQVEAAFAGLGLTALDQEPGSMVSAALVHEELAWGDAGAAVALWSPQLCGAALRELGDDAQREQLLPELLRGRGALCYAEATASGADPAGFATRARPASAGGYLLRGVKRFVLNGGVSDVAVVFAQVEEEQEGAGVGAFVVRGRPAGEGSGSYRAGARQDLLGLDAAHVGTVIFEDHWVPEEGRLRAGGRLLQAAARLFARAQLCTAARLSGVARAAYEYALEYTQEREAFGKRVAHFQANAFTLADLLMEVDAARWLTLRAAAAADGGALDLRLCAQAALQASEAAWRCADQCVQLLGGAGYIQDFLAEKWLREAQVLGLCGGSAELWRQIIAAQELGHEPEGGLLPSPVLQTLLT